MLQIILNGKRKETMADVIKKATNKFTKGLVMDFSPENTKNEVLTHALNATLLTFNGNELSLQNDMGNGRVETACLPEGYMPVGTCEYGGIIYIVSYNPLEDKSQIGCFPSPERNISRDELGEAITESLNSSAFQEIENGAATGKIINNSKYVLLKNDELHPGDKFIVTSDQGIYQNSLADLYIKKNNEFILQEHPIIALNIVSIEESGKIIYLNSSIKKYECDSDGETYKYHILGETNTNSFDQQSVDLDSYRNVLNSGYSVFKQKTSGKLALLAELIMIDSYSVTHSLYPNEQNGFDVILHHEVYPTINSSNWLTVPKLRYFYLENSQGYLQTWNSKDEYTKIPLFDETNSNYVMNQDFLNTSLKSIFTSENSSLFSDNQTLLNTAQFNFPKKDSYYGKISKTGNLYDDDKLNNTKIITKFSATKYHRINLTQIAPKKSEGGYDYDKLLPYYAKLNAKYYYYTFDKEQYSQETGDSLVTDRIYYVDDYVVSYKDVNGNDQYKQETLYKLESELQIATSIQINDENIDKYTYQPSERWDEATEEQIADASIVKWYKVDESSYTEVKTEEENTIRPLYIKTINNTLINIGPTVEEAEEGGFIYYYPDALSYIPAAQEEIDEYWNFYNSHKAGKLPPYVLYYRDTRTVRREATQQELSNYQKGVSEFYYITSYTPITDFKKHNGDPIETLNLYIRFEKDTYIPYDKFIPDISYNWIDGYKWDDKWNKEQSEPLEKAPYEDKLILYVINDYIPQKPSEELPENEYVPYDDVVLASIKLPEVLVRESIDLPFKYDYTITPCMNYGRLDHLSVSNTVDFSNLHQFNKSNFNTWKYRIDGDQVMLTFGTEVFDTYESDKVDSIILEFYDLWGFVGSLEISNKKSYNGLFTKVLYLNSLNTLSKKKINVNTYSENYQHNINITQKDGRYYINDKEVQFTSYDDGWRYTGTQNSDLESNDVGVLYHNLIYGVKTYLRRTKNKGTNNEELEFIKKQEFFLYTLPLFNDYYYTTENFNSITNPKLDFVLTYKLTDKSYKNEYSNEVINNGYYNQDKENVNNYLSGIYSGSELNSVKYYKYEGASKLYLEIGLKQDYSELGLSYDPNINNKFSCVLTLNSDTGDGTYSVGSDSEDVTIPNYILNYYNNDVQILNTDNNDVNILKFDNDSSEYTIDSEFNKYNFLNNQGSQSINIIYNFVVGYSFNINKIVETQIPATTICALFHKKPDGEYNYNDFGIYESNQEDPEDSTKQALLSDNMFYNGGRQGTGYFGLCHQKSYLKEHIPSSTQPALDQEIIEKYTIQYTPKPIYAPGTFNASHMKELSSMIGKLTFCQPHVHSWGHNDNGVSIEYGLPVIGVDYTYTDKTTGKKVTVTSDDYNKQVYPDDPFLEASNRDDLCNFKDDTFYNQLRGTRRWLFMRNPDDDPRLADNEKLAPGQNDKYKHHGHYELWPHYNMAAITKESIEQYSQFISTLDYKEVYDGWSANKGKKVRAFTGFRGFELAVFNRKMLETMKSVYAFNPDYNSLTVNIGEVSVQNYNPYITSNIISTNSKLEFKEEESLNDYIYMGTMKVSNYLKHLNENSKNDKGIGIQILQENSEKLLPQLQFNAGLDYCGTTNNPYLVSSLTYNLPVPSDLQSELEFSNGDNIIVKNSEGINSTLKGQINKKTLYGYNTNCNKLVELDVSNYTIDSNGVLQLKNVTIQENTERIILNVPDNKIYNSYSTADPCKVSINYDFPTIGNIPLNFEFRVRIHSHDGYKKTGDNYYYSYNYPFYYNSDNIYENSVYISTGSNINVTSDVSGITFYAKIKKIILEYQGQVLKNFKDCRAMSSENYRDLFDDSISELVINGTTYNKSDIKIDTITKKSIDSGKEQDLVPNVSGYYEMGIDDALRSYTINDPNKEGKILVHKIKIHQIECEVIPTTIIDNLINEVVQIPKTEEYSETVNHVYRVKEAYKDSVIYGSSITINDLIYEGNSDGHRLFLDSRNYEYDKNLLGKLFYRQRAGETNAAKYPYNSIFIYTGPCYTPETLIIKN